MLFVSLSVRLLLRDQTKEFPMKKTLAVLAVGTMLPLCAHEGIRFGAQVTTSSPMATFHSKEAKQGYGLGAFATYDLGSGQAVVAKLGADRFSKLKTGDDVVGGIETTASSISVGADYIMHLNKSKTGFYGLAGLDVQRKHVKKYEQPVVGEQAKTKANKTELGFNVGAGYDLNKNLGVQACYKIHTKKEDAKRNSYPSVSVGVTYTF